MSSCLSSEKGFGAMFLALEGEPKKWSEALRHHIQSAGRDKHIHREIS